MTFKAASDWVDAWPEEPDPVTPKLPPARPRTRKAPVETSPVLVPPPEPAPDAGIDGVTRSGEISEAVDETAASSRSEADPVPYAVGYKKPPVHSRFQPGRSGNPKGKPKRAKCLNTLVRDNLTQKVPVRTASGEKKISRIEALLHKAVEQAMKGNPRVLAELIKLYANAVPEERAEDARALRDEDITATDLATLDELRALLAGKEEAGHEHP